MEEDDKYRGEGGRQRSSGSDEDRRNSRRRPRESLSPISQPREKVQRSNRLSGEGSSQSFRNGGSRHHSSSGPAGEGTSRDAGHSRHVPEMASRNRESTARNNEGGDGSRTMVRRNKYEIIQSKPATLHTKKGTDGKQILLNANYFKVSTRPEWNIYQYHVGFTPEIELNRLKQGILSNFKNMLGGYLFDGTKLYITRKLNENLTELKTKSRQNDEYTIAIKYIGVITMSQWESLQVLNLILRRAMQGLQLQLIGKNFYDALAKIDVREFNLQLWPGYITSIRQHEQDILVCAEVSHKYMRTETLYDIMRRCGRGGNWQDEFRQKAIGMVVLTDYNNRTYRIDDIDFNSSPMTTFDCKNVPTSYVNYYMRKYQIRIRDCSQALLVSQNKDNKARDGANNIVLLIPELCRATGLTEDMKKDFNLTRRLANTTRPDPRNRINALMHFNNRLQTTVESQEILRDWNMSLEKELVEITGRTFAPEYIKLKNNVQHEVTRNGDWNDALKNMRNERNRKEMPISIPLTNWVVITPTNLARDTNAFVDSIIRVARDIGMSITMPNICTIHDDRVGSYQKELDRAADQDPQIIMVIVFNNAADKYGMIKKKCCIDRPVPAQVITKRVLTNKNLTVATKVAIQLNSKIGGIPWLISIPLLNVMFVGFDICKSKRDRNVAYAALVATMDPKTTTTYYSTVIKCDVHDNISNHLTLGITKALHSFNKKLGSFPDKICIYRSSVGDGSIKQVFEHEVKYLVEKLDAMFESSNLSKPKITFIMVSKSINTKFFAKQHNGASNPPHGTVVDDVVTLPERYDFYLVSQTTRQGTVSPTSYNVLYDAHKLKPDRLQLLTYKLCHLYYNWSGTTRVPAVCQYAKKLASLVADHLHSEPSDALEKLLYYI